jgi:hypothetical protein
MKAREAERWGGWVGWGRNGMDMTPRPDGEATPDRGLLGLGLGWRHRMPLCALENGQAAFGVWAAGVWGLWGRAGQHALHHPSHSQSQKKPKATSCDVDCDWRPAMEWVPSVCLLALALRCAAWLWTKRRLLVGWRQLACVCLCLLCLDDRLTMRGNQGPSSPK